ncbi:MAG TPA: nickel pincer cofactor biosynthesis protein LarB [Candidatus Nitrosopolaris sp.]
MDLRTIMEKFSEGSLTFDEVQRQLCIHSIEYSADNLAKLDIGREIRRGVPEVIFAEGKDYRDVVQIIFSVLKRNGMAIISRVTRLDIPKLCNLLKKRNYYVEVGVKSTTLLVSSSEYVEKKSSPKIGILSAGTSDIGVAEEARLIAKAMGCSAVVSYDVGIAGIHRLFPALQQMISENVNALVVVAGMEGALASVVASLVDIPVVGVPTSVGYGFGSGGLAALASMLQSCTVGLAVVNIDNGIGAGAFAASIAKRIAGTNANIMQKTARFKTCQP